MSVFNREYKNDLFIRAFSEKKHLLSLYNAVSGKDFTDENLITYNVMEDGLFISYKNDMSFYIGLEVNLYEHQSTYNPNMPIRGLLYFAKIYSEYISDNGINLYHNKLVTLPTPRYCVFYNGKDETGDKIELNLSDCFADKSMKGAIELTATVYNINYGRNKELMEACERLSEYSYVVNEVRRTVEGMPDKKDKNQVVLAVEMALGKCVSNDKLADLLTGERDEVTDMLIYGYDAERQRELDKRDARAEGRERGESLKMVESVTALKRSLNIDTKKACELLSYDYDRYLTCEEKEKMLTEDAERADKESPAAQERNVPEQPAKKKRKPMTI